VSRHFKPTIATPAARHCEKEIMAQAMMLNEITLALNRNAVAAISPALTRSGYAGWRREIEINSEGVEADPGGDDATHSGLKMGCGRDPG
jgi:hypothetical protein